MAVEEQSKPCTIVLHDDRVNSADVLAGNRVMHIGEFAWLSAPGARTLCISPAGLATSSNEISIHSTLAKRFGFENRTEGQVLLIDDPDAATASHVELLFRDQFLSRADMWQLMGAVQDTVVYQGQVMNYLGSETAEVKQVYIAGKEVQSAISVHPHTKPIFRSGSARYTILVEVSREMLQNWVNGELMYERLIGGFLPELFGRWSALKVRHQITVIMFGRLGESAGQDASNRHGEDFFHVLVSEMPSTSWPQISRRLKRAFNDHRLPHAVSLAAESNILEAIHLTAMDFADDQTNAHLMSTGTSIIAVTAGAGLFDADHTLLKQTTELLVGNSIGVDIVALSSKPLHPVPLFRYQHNGSTEFALPHWVDISYWKSPFDTSGSSWNVVGSDGPVDEIALPFLRDKNPPAPDAATLEHHDCQVFQAATAQSEPPLSLNASPTKPVVVGSVETMKGRPSAASAASSTIYEAEEVTISAESPVSSLSSSSNKDQITRAKRQRLPRHPLMQTGRQISVGPKGLALSRSLASTTVSTTNVQPKKDTHAAAPDTSNGLARVIRASLARQPSQQSLTSRRMSDADESLISKPIDIQTGHESINEDVPDPASDVAQKIADTMVGNVLENDVSLSPTPKAGAHFPRKGSLNDTLDMLSPWVMLLNPCNPRRDNMKVASQYRKWQHVFPRAVSSGDFKWSSMISPAALPLTAEYKPSAFELEAHYRKIPRRHVISNTSLRDEAASTLVERLINVRLIRGFQIVAIKDSGSDQTYQRQNKPTLMSLGRRYHEVQRLSDFEVQVVQYDPKTGIGSEFEEAKHFLTSYEPKMSMPTGMTVTPEVTYHTESSIGDWASLDDHILGLGPMPDVNVTFKVRLLLIPVELSAYSRAAGLTDDERHERRIDGIQRLTQTWQRQRHFSAEDQQHHASLIKAKSNVPAERDPNPLAIDYQTKDPSAIVNAHDPTLAIHAEDGEISVPLFADAEKHHSSNFDVARLVKQIQKPPPYGVEMRDRRWLTVTHLKCFRGDEMTTWLLGAFQDLELRDDAVAIGNELMNRGVFHHVRQKHKFRDGHYFYQISHAHRTTDYPDTQGLFKMPIPWRSIPATPATESMKSPALRPVSGDSSSSSGKSTPVQSPQDQRKLLLSQKMQYNVDPQRKSDHLQIIDLHYDRIHNPENCYHIQLEWLGASTKLVKDAISRWSSVVEGYGLRVCQLPLQEASRYREHHPFDQPQPVRLAVKPPDKTLATPIIEPHTSSPRRAEDRFAYHKALLRKNDFVLDYEAASAFSSDLHVTYSWGLPNFTYTQFVHKSGLVLAQITGDDNGDFILLHNRLASTRLSHSTRQVEVETVESIVKNFKNFCCDEEGLRQFYAQADKPRPGPSPFIGGASLTADFDVPPINLPPHLLHRNQGYQGYRG